MSWKFLLNPQFTVIKDSRQGHRVGLNNRRYSKEHFEDQHFFGRGTIISTCEIFPIWPKCSRIFPIEREQVPVPKGAVTALRRQHSRRFTMVFKGCQCQLLPSQRGTIFIMVYTILGHYKPCSLTITYTFHRVAISCLLCRSNTVHPAT